MSTIMHRDIEITYLDDCFQCCDEAHTHSLTIYTICNECWLLCDLEESEELVSLEVA